MIMNFKVVRKNGTVYDMKELGLIINKFEIDSPSYSHVTEELDGMDGALDIETKIEPRSMRAELTIAAYDFYDYEMARNEVFRFFSSKEPFYLIRDLEPGKRWLVKCDSGFSIAQLTVLGRFTINFIAHFPFAESIGTTMDPFTFDLELWQIGQGLIGEDVFYTHTVPSFSIYNAGDISIDPCRMPLKITYKGASNNLVIRNKTTGDEWSYTGTTAAGDTLQLKGIRSLKNDVSVFKNTNKKIITLVPGWNEFELVGASGSFSISFDFRFYYL